MLFVRSVAWLFLLSPGQNATGQNAIGQNASGQNAIGQNVTGQNVTGQNATGQNAIGQNATGQNATGQNATNSGICFYFLQMLQAEWWSSWRQPAKPLTSSSLHPLT